MAFGSSRQGSVSSRARLRVVACGLCAGAVIAAAPAAAATPDRAFHTPVAKAGSAGAQTSGLSRGGLEQELRGALRSVGGSKGAWVRDLGADSSPVLFSSSATKRRILASNEKLFTTAAALGRFGADHRFETAIYARGTLEGAGDRILDGNLVVVGDGDPALGSESFARRNNLPLTPVSDLARAVETAGISKVKGKVLADDSIFDRRRGIPATGFGTNSDLSALSGLSFNSGRGYSGAPELEAVRAVRRALQNRGVKVTRGIGRGRVRAKGKEPLGVAASPTLASLAEETNEPSNNFFAEMLLKRLGAGKSKQGTTKRGARRSKRFARKAGTKVKAADGSGLSRANRASPKQVGKLLAGVMKDKFDFGGAFRDSLALAGREGTLRHRMRGTAAEGRCEAKTGTLSDVSALSGYCQVDGEPVVFSILMNNTNTSAARNAQDRMAAAIARYQR